MIMLLGDAVKQEKGGGKLAWDGYRWDGDMIYGRRKGG